MKIRTQRKMRAVMNNFSDYFWQSSAISKARWVYL
jgi:hypothetical protein